MSDIMKNNQLLILVFGGLIILIILVIAFLALIGSSLGNSVAIIPIQGEISYGQANLLGGEITNPDTVKEELKKAEEDSTIRSILLEVNSPGGTPVASEEIMEAVKECKKPVIVWVSDVGASGAYLASSSADKIIASPSSQVGSIGVLMDFTDLSQLYQNIGVNRYAITGGKYKDMGADYRNLTPEERNMLQGMVNEDYDYFISLVAENRKLDRNYVRSIAEGKVYTGKQAKNIKLVDETGSKEKALDIAAKLGGISGSYNVISMKPSSSFEDIISGVSTKTAYALGRGIGSFMQKGSIEYVYY
jgi:protease IV